MPRRSCVAPRAVRVQPGDREHRREPHEECETVDVHGLYQPEKEAGNEGRPGPAQGAAIAQQPQRGEEEQLDRDLGRAVTGEGDLRHQQRKGRGGTEREQRVPEQA